MSASTKVSVIGLILSLTLAYSLYYKRKYRHFFESGGGLVLKTLPEFALKDLSSGEMVTSEGIFERGEKIRNDSFLGDVVRSLRGGIAGVHQFGKKI